MDRSALAPAALRMFSGIASRRKQSRTLFYQPSEWKHRQVRAGRRFRRRRTLVKALRIVCCVFLVSLTATSILLVRSYRSYARLVDARLARGYLTAAGGIYAAPRTLRRNQKLTCEDLAAALRRAGYIESDTVTEVWNGGFTVGDDVIEIRPARRERSPSGVRVAFDRGGRIANIIGGEVTRASFALA